MHRKKEKTFGGNKASMKYKIASAYSQNVNIKTKMTQEKLLFW